MIIYFSATGNSAFVAKRIAAALQDSCVNLLPILQKGSDEILSSEKPWVLVVPTYAFQIPRLIRDFLRKKTLKGSKKLYVVMTCGGTTGGSAAHLQDLCEEIDMEWNGLGVVVMPENYIAMFPVPSEAQSSVIVMNALPKIDAIASDILAGKKLCDGNRSAFSKMFSSALNHGFYTAAIQDKKFSVNQALCNGCGKCQQNCPLLNIQLDAQHTPTWNGNCTHCMACICGCPKNAIEYGKVTLKKRRYQCPEF